MVKNSTRGYGSPGRYIQGPRELENLPRYTSKFGDNVFALIDQFFFEALTGKLKKLYEEAGGAVKTAKFCTEVTEKQIEEATAQAKEAGANVIIGIGGGKTLDISKAIADNLGCAVIVAPTSASTDAPTSRLSIIYSEEGEHLYARNNKKSPDVVLVDSKIIADGPVRFLVSGMGDALSTVFEARANAAADAPNYIDDGFRHTKTALAIAEACYETLIENGLQAKISCENNIVTEALEDIIEVNTLMSGLGFENTSCAGAHSVGDGITALPAGKNTLHGERVAFGVICQLVAEGQPMALIEEAIDFCLSVGLPVTLEDLGVEATQENLKAMAKCSMNSFWDAEPMFISEEQVIDIMVQGDALGHYFKGLA